MKKSKLHDIVSVIGLFCLVIGLYASLRLVINLFAYQNYPTNGVLPTLPGTYVYTQTEADCQLISSQTMFDINGQPRQTTDIETKQLKEQVQSCLSSIEVAREQAKTNDINLATFFLFIGVSLLVLKRFFLKE